MFGVARGICRGEERIPSISGQKIDQPIFRGGGSFRHTPTWGTTVLRKPGNIIITNSGGGRGSLKYLGKKGEKFRPAYFE